MPDFKKMAFNPPDGYRNIGAFPTAPASEADFRDSMQSLLDQLRDYLNNDMPNLPAMSLYRQAIINGGCEVCQRIAPLGSMALASGSSAYVVDHIKSCNNGSGANATVSQVAVSDLDGAANGLQIVHAAAPTTGGRLAHTYTVEAKDAYKFAGQKAVFALKVKAAGGMDRVSVNARYNTTESAIINSSTLILSTGQVLINNLGWTVIPLVVTLPVRATLTTTGVIGFEIVGSKTSAEAAGDGFIITEIELIKSDRDLGFQPRSFAEELALCQRYYEKSYPNEFALGAADASGAVRHIVGTNTVTSTDYILYTVKLNVPKRISAPTISYWDTAGNANKIATIDKAATPTINVLPTYPPNSKSNNSFTIGHNAVGFAGFQFHYAVDADL